MTAQIWEPEAPPPPVHNIAESRGGFGNEGDFEPSEGVLDPAWAAAQAYRLQAVNYVRNHGLTGAGEAQPRLAQCLSHKCQPEVQVVARPGPKEKGTKAGLTGLVVCGRKACPNCSYRIAFHRAKQLGRIFRAAEAEGFRVLFVTLTHPHSAGEDLADLFGRHARAQHSFHNHYAMKALRKKHGFVGSVSALEQTKGGNGWHVHRHLAFIFTPQADINRQFAEMAGSMFAVWKASAENAGLGEPDWKGFDAQVAPPGGRIDRLGDYLSKLAYTPSEQYVLATEAMKAEGELTADALELAYSVAKQGRVAGSLTPFQILSRMVENHSKMEPELRLHYRALWQEWVAATKGKHLLRLSRDLAKRFQVPDFSDEEAAEQPTDDEEVVAEPARLVVNGWWKFGLKIDDEGRSGLIEEASGHPTPEAAIAHAEVYLRGRYGEPEEYVPMARLSPEEYRRRSARPWQRFTNDAPHPPVGPGRDQAPGTAGGEPSGALPDIDLSP